MPKSRKADDMAKHETNRREDDGNDKADSIGALPVLLLILLAGTMIVNQYMINGIDSASESTGAAIANTALSANNPSASSSSTVQSASANGVIPVGVPAIYGKELGISFDDVKASNPRLADQTIAKLSAYDRSLTLTGDKLKRYIAITSQISCEYCCGAQSIIFPDGSAACGCAHSYAMRGLAKYLLEKHADEYTDNQILEELGKWKALFFPGKMIAKAEVLKQKGIEFNYINLASNKYRGIEQGAQSGGGGMVGGC